MFVVRVALGLSKDTWSLMTKLSEEKTQKVGCMAEEGDERKTHCRNAYVVNGFVKTDVESLRGGGSWYHLNYLSPNAPVLC